MTRRTTRSRGAALTSVCIAGLAFGCVGATPAGEVPAIPVLREPLLDEVTIRGLEFMDQRLASRTTQVAQVSSHGAAYGTGGHATSRGTATAVGTSVTMESFTNDELLRELQLALEDSRIARRIVSDCRYVIEGSLVRAESDTGAGRIAWNVVNAVSLLCLLGGPFLGSTEAEVQLRLYDDGELVRAFHGVGRGNWWAVYAIAQTIPRGRREATIHAAHLAVRDAVARLAADGTLQTDRIAQP